MDYKNTLTMPKGSFPMRANLPSWEGDMVAKWDEIDLYHELLKKNEGHDAFYLHDGPPYANGPIHCGHALNKIVKDIIIKSKNLEGFYVPYTPGWDTHGLPIENCVTKSGVDRKKTPASVFRKKCREYALKQVEIQKAQMLRLGLIGDYHNPYLTLRNDYEADQVKIFSKLLKDGLIYKGLKPVNWSWSSESALAEAEIEYYDVKATTIYFRFKTYDGKGILKNDTYFLVWTTTGWTIPSNQGLCLNPKLTYGLYHTDKGDYIFLTDLKDKVVEEAHFAFADEMQTFKGRQLEGILVTHPYQNRQVPVCVDDYVTADSGTGIVHLGPGHGADDYRIGKKYNLPIICTVDSKGYMNEGAGEETKGLFYEECSTKVIELMREKGNLIATEDIVHAYPHDWRTKKPTIFRATEQWFISLKDIKEELLDSVSQVNFTPNWGKVRLMNMIKDRDDWCISRQRLWGVPIPIIYNSQGEAVTDQMVFEHIEELFREHSSDIWYEKEADELLPEDYLRAHQGETFTKETDIMDVWFDSGSSFLASDISLSHPFPADIYFEGNDQYRGWYNSSLILSIAYTGLCPYKNILTHGFIVDQNGAKFSKSQKIGIDPKTICDKYGADILRLWTTTIDYTSAEIKLSPDLLKSCSDQYRKIRNTFKFMLSNLLDDDCGHAFDPTYKPTNLSTIDECMLNRLKEVLRDIKNAYDRYDISQVTSLILNFFVNDLSSFYLDFNKDYLYCEKKDSTKRRNCQFVIYNIVKSIAIAYSPILSFTCEEIYNTLNVENKKKSIFLEDYPDLGAVDEKLSAEYKKLKDMRDRVNNLLEEARKAGIIGSSSEAKVTYLPTSDDQELLNDFTTAELARIFIVSSFEIGSSNVVVKHTGVMCDRCWNHFDEVVEHEGSHLCPRCYQVVGGLDDEN